MKRRTRGFLSILAGLVIILIAVISMQPETFRVERSLAITAPAEKIFPYVNNQAKWAEWSPWAKMDPNTKFTYEGPAEGVGAVGSWDGNMDVGKGSSTILESRANEYIKFRLDFIKPMKGTNESEFTFKTEGDKTLVTWSMSGTNNFLAKAINLVIDCEKMVGEQFEKGLGNLKSITE